MFRLHKYFEKQAFFAIITVQLLTLGDSRVISECSSEVGGFQENTDAACRTQYPWTYCNGADSTYCTSELCLEDNECISADVPLAPVQQITPPTDAPVPIPVVTPPTMAPVPVPAITPPTDEPVPIPTVIPTITPPTAVQTTTETTAIIREKCKLNENFAVPYLGNCRYFYHCANGYFGIGDCGFYMFFDANERKCKIKTPTSCR